MASPVKEDPVVELVNYDASLKKKKKKKKQKKKEYEPVVYMVDVKFEVTKRQKEEPFSSGYMRVRVPEGVTFASFLRTLKKDYVSGLKPVKSLSFYDLEVTIINSTDGRVYHMTSEQAWQDLLPQVLGGNTYCLMACICGSKLRVHNKKRRQDDQRGPRRKRAKTGQKETTKEKLALEDILRSSGHVVRTEQQTEKLKEMKEAAAKLYGDQVQVLDEIHMKCVLCGYLIVLNHIYYIDYMKTNHYDNGRCQRRIECQAQATAKAKEKSSSRQRKLTDMFKNFESSTEESISELEYSSDSKDEDSSSDGDMEVDPCIAMLHTQIENGCLSKDHIFYRYLKSSLSFAQQIDNPSAQFSWDPAVKSFARTLKRLGGVKTANLVRGPGFLSQKFGGTYNFKWEDWNFPLPPVVDNIGYTTCSGIIKHYLLGFLTICCDDRELVEPLVDTASLKIVPLVAGKGGMAIKPGFEFDRRTKEIVGGHKNLSLEDVEELHDKAPSEFRNEFCTEAETWCLSTLDYKSHMAVGVDYEQKAVSGDMVLKNLTWRISELESCTECLMATEGAIVSVSDPNSCVKSSCPMCITDRTLCKSCEAVGHTHWNPKFRACNQCILQRKKCCHGAVLAAVTDCESKNLSAQRKLRKSEDPNMPASLLLTQPIPDPPHRAKNLDQSSANWFLLIGGGRFNRSLLRTLRNRDTAVSKELQEAVTDRALRRRDRQDTQYVYQSTSEIIQRVLTKVSFVVQTLVPEPFRKSEVNIVGILKHPTAVCVGTNSTLYISDYGANHILKARLHYPVDVDVIKSDFKSPTGIAYAGGILFVCEMESGLINYTDVAGTVVLQPRRMKKGALVQALQCRNISTEGKGVKELQAELNVWLEQKGLTDILKKTWHSLVLCNGPCVRLAKPLALAASFNEQRNQWTLYVGIPEKGQLCRILITSTGVRLEGQMSILLEGNFGITGLSLSKGDLFITDNRLDGGILIMDLATQGTKKVISCSYPYDVCVTDEGRVAVSQPDNRRVTLFSEVDGTYEETDTVGLQTDTILSKDGCNKSAAFAQPTGLACEGNSLYVCDTGVGSLKLVTPMGPYQEYLKHVNNLMKIFGIHYSFPSSLPDAITKLEVIVDYFKSASNSASTRYNKYVSSLQGPQGVPSATTVATLEELLTSMKELQGVLHDTSPDYVTKAHVKALTTLPNEHLHSCMRMRYPMPTLLEFAQAFTPVLEEAVKRTTNCGFQYYTGRQSYYEVPKCATHFEDMPCIPKPPSVDMSPQNQKKMRDFITKYGESVRQMTVRGMSTLDKAGTLPISAYGETQSTVSLLNLSEVLRTDLATEVVAKGDLFVMGTHNVQAFVAATDITGTFIISKSRYGCSNKVKTICMDIFVEDPEDPLQFHRWDRADVPVTLLLFKLNINAGKHHIDLDDETYSQCSVWCTSQRPVVSEDEPNDPDEAETVPQPALSTTRKGRVIKLPSRFKD